MPQRTDPLKVKRQSMGQKMDRALVREGHQQGTHPQEDIFEDSMEDRGQEIMDDIGAEEDMDDYGSVDK